MKKLLLLFVAVAVLLSSCAATWNNVGSFRMTAPLADNAAASCSVAPVLWPVSASAPRMMHLRLIQGAYAWEDSTATTAGSEVSFTPPAVPSAAAVTVVAWASDVGGAGCPVTITRTPATSTRPPAAPTIIAY